MNSPTAAEIAAIRASCGLTQSKIAQLLHANDRTWRQWEAGDRRMHPAFWELLNLKLAPKNILKPIKKLFTGRRIEPIVRTCGNELRPIRPGSGEEDAK